MNELNNNKKKKLLFVTARLPYPASSGRKNVMYNYCKILHEVYDYKIYVASFLEDGDIVEPLPNFIHKVFVLNNVRGKKKIVNLLSKTLLLKKFPMQVSLFYDKDVQGEINSLLNKIKPDVAIADMVRTTEYLRNYSGYKIADLDDMLSIRYERQLAMGVDGINPYGAYLFSLPKTLQKLLSVSILKRYILRNEINLLKKYEREISSIFDKTVFVAQREADILNKEMRFNKAMGIPLGVDVEYYSALNGTQIVKKDTIAFLGAMSVAHNEAGALHFINNIFPIILKSNPNAKFVIVGGGVTEKVKNAAKGNNNIIFTGRVKDVREYIGTCEVFVCPLTFGSGIKTKNLEAMAMGVPVVTTSIGAENIDAVNEKEWLMADDEDEFADRILEILGDSKKHDELSKNALEFVKNQFTWKVAEEKFREIV